MGYREKKNVEFCTLAAIISETVQAIHTESILQKTVNLIEMPFEVVGQVNQRNNVLDPPRWEQFFFLGGGYVARCNVSKRNNAALVLCKTDEPIKRVYRVWSPNKKSTENVGFGFASAASEKLH